MMTNQVVISIETGYFKYPFVYVTYEGTKLHRFYKDGYLKSIIFDAAVDAKDDLDIFDFCNFIFSSVNQAIKRHYTGQDVILREVEVIADDEKFAVAASKE